MTRKFLIRRLTEGILLFLLCGCGPDSIPTRLLEGESPRSGFVTRSDRQFYLDGKPFFFHGTNLYEIGLLSGVSEQDVDQTLRRVAERGMKVVRMWGFCNGGWNGAIATQWSPGHFNSDGIRRMDWALAKASDYGLKVIFVLVNYEAEYGGMQWWVDQVLGTGKDRELFYTDSRVQAAYRDYVLFWTNHRNGINNRVYKDDPTIMSWELANEPHVRDNYERDRGINPGQLAHDWLWNMAEFLDRETPRQLIATGEEGYRTDGGGDRFQWINNGLKGSDFVSNLYIPWIDYATLHPYFDQWKIPYDDRGWMLEQFITDRFRIASDAKKPLVVEEIGFQRWYGDRSLLLREVFQHTNKLGIPGTLVWRIQPNTVDDWSYEFDFDDPGAQAVFEQASYMNARSY